MIFRDKLGWPVERIKGRYVFNFLRLLIHTNWKTTIAYCCCDKSHKMTKSSNADNPNTCDGSLKTEKDVESTQTTITDIHGKFPASNIDLYEKDVETVARILREKK